MFSEAARVLTSLLRGEKLPKVSDGGFRTVENKTVFSCCLQDNFCQFAIVFTFFGQLNRLRCYFVLLLFKSYMQCIV